MMLCCSNGQTRHPGEGRNPDWTPAFAGATSYFLWFVLFFTHVSAGNAETTTSPLDLLKTPYVSRVETKSILPPGIAYIFTDLKFDGTVIKVCEFGPCPYAGLTDAPVFINGKAFEMQSPYWALFWEFLSSFKLPIWRVGGWEEADARSVLSRVGGRYVDTVSALEKDSLWQACAQRATNSVHTIQQVAGIIVSTTSIGGLKKRYPGFLYVNNQIGGIVSRKDLTNRLLSAPELIDYKPRFGIYEKRYYPELASAILQQLQSPFVVIKPVASMRGRGVTMVSAAELDAVLSSILSGSARAQKTEFAHWAQDKQKEFIVEAYAPSKSLTDHDKTYDPTMRIVSFLSHDQGVITVHVVGGYWKTPPSPLDALVELNQKHITTPHVGLRLGISEDDMRVVKSQVAALMQKMYQRILTAK